MASLKAFRFHSMGIFLAVVILVPDPYLDNWVDFHGVGRTGTGVRRDHGLSLTSSDRRSSPPFRLGSGQKHSLRSWR